MIVESRRTVTQGVAGLFHDLVHPDNLMVLRLQAHGKMVLGLQMLEAIVKSVETASYRASLSPLTTTTTTTTMLHHHRRRMSNFSRKRQKIWITHTLLPLPFCLSLSPSLYPYLSLSHSCSPFIVSCFSSGNSLSCSFSVFFILCFQISTFRIPAGISSGLISLLCVVVKNVWNCWYQLSKHLPFSLLSLSPSPS